VANRRRIQIGRGLSLTAAELTIEGQPITLLVPSDAVVSWTAPTLNTDGSALTGDDAIDRYRISWYVDDVFVNSQLEDASPALISDLAPGTYLFYVTAIAVDGEESDPWYVGSKVIS
jgi:hypothetical protein